MKVSRAAALRWLPAFLAVVVALLFGGPARALDPSKAFHHYVRDEWSLKQGLPQISVQAITQDRQGYLWVGTQAGLARFDGVRFTAFTPDNEPALPGLWTRSLFLDSAGRLWIGTYKGLAVYENGRFRAVPVADIGRYGTLDIYDIREWRGAIIVASNRGLFEVRGGLLVPRDQRITQTQSLLVSGGALWVGGLGGVSRLTPAGSEWLPMPAELDKAVITRLAQAQGRVWVGTSLGLYTYGDGQWRRASGEPGLQSSPTTMLQPDRDGNLWAASNAGLGRFHDGMLAEFVAENSPEAFKGVISAFEDREGNLWLGSQWQGLARLWNGWTRRYSTSEGLNEPIVWSLAPAPDGAIWVGTNDGLSVFRDGRFTTVLHGADLPHPHAYNLLADADRIWVGTRRGLVIYRNGRVERPPAFEPMANAQINGIVRARDGTIWIPTSDGLFRWKDERLDRYGQAEGLRDPRVRLMRELHDGRLLVGSQEGLYLWQDGKFVPQGLPADTDVTALHELGNGDWVVGTLAEVLFLRHGQHWTRVSAHEGLPANSAFFLTDDDRGYLWLAGIRGIERVPLADLAALREGKTDRVNGEMLLNERGDRLSGQQGYCCNGAGNAKGFLQDHVLWLPTRDGVVTLDTHGIVKNPVPPGVVIERLQYLGQWHDAAAVRDTELPDAARDLAFDFSALSFQDPASVRIAFRLVGYDQDWRELQAVTPRSANYTNLPSGKYVFEVKAANNVGVWSPQVAQLPFQIHPYFHETPLFDLLALLLLGTVIYAGYRMQRRAHLAQRALLEQQVHERTQQLHAANLQLEHASQTDPLTGLRNRRYLANQIPADLAFYDREHARGANNAHSLVFAVVDIDHFKRINDSHGHAAGDLVLQQFAQAMTRLVRTGDYIARWGGEEFLLVFRPIPRQFVPVLGDRICTQIASQLFDIGHGQHLSLTCSVGLSEYPLFRDAQQQVGWEQMVELADAALYWVKQHGRNGWAELRPTRHADLATVMRNLKTGLDKLLADGQLEVLSSHDAGPNPRPPES